VNGHHRRLGRPEQIAHRGWFPKTGGDCGCDLAALGEVMLWCDPGDIVYAAGGNEGKARE
jgi:hypothetical protein